MGEKKLDRSLISVELNSSCRGFELLQELSAFSSLRILEARAMGQSCFWILAEIRADQAEFALAKCRETGALSESVSDVALIIDPTEAMLEAWFSLKVESPGAALSVLETETLSGLFDLVNEIILRCSLVILEMKALRGQGCGGYALLSGSVETCQKAAEAARARLTEQGRQGVSVCIRNPTRTLIDFISLQS